MSEHTPDPAVKGLARRRLLRGTFAAPVVLTMYSGGALAATSATCVAKVQANPQTGGVATGTPSDTFLRRQLHQMSTGDPAVISYWLAGDSLSGLAGATAIVQPGKFTRFLEGTNLLSTAVGEVNMVLPQTTPPLPLPTLSSPAKWVALRFNGTGTLVGVGATPSGSAITQSCWTSVFDK